MNHSISNTNPAPENSANGETPAKPASQRRYRRSSRPKSAAAQTETTTTAATATISDEVTAAGQPGGAAASKPSGPSRRSRSGRPNQRSANPPAAVETPAAVPLSPPVTPPAAKPPVVPSQRPRTRSQRNGRRSKGDVQLVVPSTPETGEPEPTSGVALANSTERGSVEVAPAPEAAPTTPVTGPLPAPVPVLTEPAAAVTAQLPEKPTEESTASRRYRFDRRPAAAETSSLAPGIRPERLSGFRTPTTQTGEDSTAAEPSSPLEPSSAPEPPEVEEPFNFFEPRTRSHFAETTGDDILAELGLRDAQHHAQPKGEAELEEVESSSQRPSAQSDETVAQSSAQEAQAPDISSAGGGTGDGEGESDGEGEGDGVAAARPRRPRRRRRPSHTAAGETPPAIQSPETPGAAASAASSRSTTLPGLDVPVPQAAPRSPASFPRAGHDRFDDYGTVVEPPPYPGADYNQSAASYQQPPLSHPVAPPALPSPQGQPSWDISTAQQHIGQDDSPFGAPAPSFARGFGPQPRGVASPARDLYAPRPTRTERGTDTPPMSSNQLANIVSGAIAQQTDRLLAELRHQQYPPSMTVMFPPAPSTERLGIFVDVANLLYSSRSLRINIDFGKLLEFLRGNRRLIRAHAYAPTNPDPGADQAFLVAVKGMGYRITTKNYKTFSSGAKKADMDLDLCMDIVRLVDAGALDTVVLVSGDSDFLPLLEYCSDHGVRVEAAAFDDSAAMILRQSCDLFINLTLAPDIRADR